MIGDVQKDVGGLGYPAIQTVISGMELLGFLMSGGREKEAGFKYFWSNYLVKKYPIYAGLDNIFYKVIRHGTAHLFIVKSGVSISKSRTMHLEIISKDGRQLLNVDLKNLLDDFLSCYEEIKKTLLITKDEYSLKQFWQGFSKLFEQMRQAQQIVETHLKDKMPKQSLNSFQPNTIVYNVSSSTIASLQQANASTMTLPPEQWLKKNNNKADQ